MMIENFWDNFASLFAGGGRSEDLSLFQIAVRTVFVYLVALAIVRIGKRRFMGRYSAFDIILGFIIGSVMARAITGAIRLADMVAAVSILMLLHWLISTVTFYSKRARRVFEKAPRELIVDGEIQRDAMAKSKIAESDLLQALREEANLKSPEDVEAAYLEHDGRITVIPKTSQPRVVETRVENGVQTVRIKIERE